jgi:hypothetical protein
MVLLRRARRWWLYLLAAVYALTLCFNASQEAFGPADSGLRYSGRLPDHRPLEVESVVPGSPLQRAGLLKGDVIESVGGRPVLGQTDWFLVRAHLRREAPTEMSVRRGDEYLRLWFTITTPNWRTLDGGEIAFQITRAFVLLLALVVAFARPDQLPTQLVSLLLAMVSVAEAFPPAGWAGSLRQLPWLVSLPIALASVAEGSARPESAPNMLAMPSPFLDSAVIRRVQRIWGVMPSLFINPWPAYSPARQTWLVELWVGTSLMAFCDRSRPARGE